MRSFYKLYEDINHFEPIIPSLLDSDYYKFTMAQVVFHKFPEASVVYKFINRGKTEFPKGFDEQLWYQINQLSNLRFKPDEISWLRSHGHFAEDYLDFLENFHFKPHQISIKQADGKLEVLVHGLWKETIFWEIPLMSLISELYYKMSNKVPSENCEQIIADKAKKLSDAGVKWIDFGSRRRFSHNVQNSVDKIMSQYPGYAGTSNPYFAKKYNLKPVGTYAHESIMGMQGEYGFKDANKKWMDHWLGEYNGKLGIALTDTLTTDAFLKDFDGYYASKFSGVRHDSGDPFAFGDKIINHYKELGINPRDKTIVFSDKLDTETTIKLNNYFKNRINVVFGIGTHLTNDCGHPALNIVVKIVSIDFGNGNKDVVKLSDETGKHTGNPEDIQLAKKTLGIS